MPVDRLSGARLFGPKWNAAWSRGCGLARSLKVNVQGRRVSKAWNNRSGFAQLRISSLKGQSSGQIYGIYPLAVIAPLSLSIAPNSACITAHVTL